MLIAILGIGFLIFIHEYGHYTACKLTRTRVETFSIGFGPRLFGWERPRGGKRRLTWGRRQLSADDHAMDFRVALIPLGGYVKMAGENPGQPKSGAGDEFSSKSIAQRLLIVVAGVVMNSLTAFAFYAIAIHGGVLKEPALVGQVTPGYPAWAAGLRTGDRIVELDGHVLPSFQDLRMEAAFLPAGEERPMVVERDGRRETLRVRARYDEALGVVQLGVRPTETLTVGEGEGALVVGALERADVDGIPAVGGLEARSLLERALESGRASVEVRNAAGRSATVAPRPLRPDENPPQEKIWRLGIAAFGPPVVEQARGLGAGLQPGDALLAARAGERRVPLESSEAWARLPFDVERLDALVVRRGQAEPEVPLSGVSDRGAVLRLLQDVFLRKPGNAVRPLEAGHVAVSGGFLLRYPASPAQGRVLPGERVVKIGDRTVATLEDVLAFVTKLQSGDPVTLRVAAADGTERDEKVAPVALEVAARIDASSTLHKEPLASEGLLDSVSRGGGRFWREVRNTFATIGAFFTGNISFNKNIAGPVTLVRVSSDQESFLDLLWWLAYVSVMLAVLNILPVPVLDGGHLIYLAAEKIRGRPLSEATMAKMQWVGLLLLLTLMVFAIKNDILLLGK